MLIRPTCARPGWCDDRRGHDYPKVIERLYARSSNTAFTHRHRRKPVTDIGSSRSVAILVAANEYAVLNKLEGASYHGNGGIMRWWLTKPTNSESYWNEWGFISV